MVDRRDPGTMFPYAEALLYAGGEEALAAFSVMRRG